MVAAIKSVFRLNAEIFATVSVIADGRKPAARRLIGYHIPFRLSAP